MRVLAVLLLTLHPAFAKTIELEFPRLVHRVQVSFPENYDASKKWPAVFYYHGTNGIPDTKFIEHHTDQRNWIVVGMSYLQRGQFTFTPESLADEMQILHSVRHYLAGKYNLDPERVYVAGFSKGGWMCSLLIQRDPSLAGAAIMGAGYLHRIQAEPGPFRKRTPVFLGVGRKDGNYPFSLRAVTYFRSLKAPVTMETWHDLAHAFLREGSPALRQWLAVEASSGKISAAKSGEWLAGRLAEIEAMDDPIARWLALRDTEDMPYFRQLPDGLAAEVKSLLKEIEATPEVRPEAEALAAHRKILRKEIGSHDKENYEQLLLDYLELSQSSPKSRQGQLAYHDHLRVERLLKHYAEQERKQAEEDLLFPPQQDEEQPLDPTIPSDGRRIPRNPLVR